ncbi:MAG: hypothetical protein P0Y49_17215 [Candidatus Pedobacter colombiensis]|uniref:Uncharacterized protein n=1 Tax=Candidatus Pedobacter colombiensis TaxID=3121371 RepID=A0AAJ5W5V4_9SPHI|nr:hypothetical protein [Pedobacter sp.]WEK18532.1 MAG: hypothetical protein P0Y49_17215 [Pedobacter sp.]
MTNQFKSLAIALMTAAVLFVSSCKKNNDIPVVKEGIERSEIILTEVTGAAIEAHGDHFHGLTDLTAGAPVVIKFNEKGIATANGHLHLEANAVYKMELKAWDYTGKEVQNQFIQDKATADQFKAFLVGGNLILNKDSKTESGAVFQPKEQNYADGSIVTGQYETTGILSYLTIGHDNQGPTKEITYILRKLNKDVKATITRSDWNHNDYATKFAGQDLLKLKFEIHVEEGHGH